MANSKVRVEITNQQLARHIKRLLDDDPTLTVQQIAAEHGVDEDQVVQVLDSWTPDGQAGVGRGGNWIPEEVRQQLVEDASGE